MANLFLSERRKYQPPLPPLLRRLNQMKIKSGAAIAAIDAIRSLFPLTGNFPLLHFTSGEKESADPLHVGTVFSGGQAAGGHNVLIGLFDALKDLHPDSRLFGFLGGPAGIIENRYIELLQAQLELYRNTGGFDLIGSGRTKIESAEQLEAVGRHCTELELDGLVIIGGDDSNTNAAQLAEYFLAHRVKTRVIGVPKTIDGDLKNNFIECSFGFDTACKIYASLIGNICRDAQSGQKYTHFIKLMGRSASHIALECALQTHPNLVLLGEEIAAKEMTLEEIVEAICSVIVRRAGKGKNYNVILIPEGIIEFIPEVRALIQQLNGLLAEEGEFHKSRLSEAGQRTFTTLPKEIQNQLLLDRDPHGNVQVSHIATEQLLIEMVRTRLSTTSGYKGKFSPVGHFFGYEGRSGYPSNFDANYCYSLGFTAAALINFKQTGYMCVLQNLSEPIEQWSPAGIPLTAMMAIEERKGKRKPVIKKALVDLGAEPYKQLELHRQTWSIDDNYAFPGPIQYFGPPSLSDATTLTLKLEHLNTAN